MSLSDIYWNLPFRSSAIHIVEIGTSRKTTSLFIFIFPIVRVVNGLVALRATSTWTLSWQNLIRYYIICSTYVWACFNSFSWDKKFSTNLYIKINSWISLERSVHPRFSRCLFWEMAKATSSFQNPGLCRLGPLHQTHQIFQEGVYDL